MARSAVWCAFAGGDGTTEENLIGIYTSRTKARRAILDYFEVKRAKWDGDFLDRTWLHDQFDDFDSYGYVSRRQVQ